jgi:LemA protein
MFKSPTNLLILLAVIGGYLLVLYNSLARMKVRIKEAWSQIDVHLKRRADLIPNIVETVKGYASHEKEVFEKVTKARSALMKASTVEEAEKADNMLTGALKTLFAVAEAYPELKAQVNFSELQKELSETEDKVAYSRQFYNATVRDFNTKIVTFPNNIISKLFGFKREPFFEASPGEREAVKVKF